MSEQNTSPKTTDTDRYVRSATNRRGEVSPELIEKQFLRLSELCTRLGEKAAQMRAGNITLKNVDGHRKFAHGQEKIEAYLSQIDKVYQRTVHAAEQY